MSELGMTLREAREAMDLKLEDLQEQTKIQKRYLLAIEEGDYDRLPGHFYTRAFIKSYAEAVGLDSNELFETYRSEIPKSGVEIESLPPRNTRESIRPSRPSSGGIAIKNGPLAALIFVALAIAVGVWYLAAHLISGNNGAAEQTKSTNTSYTNTTNIGSGTKANTGSQTKSSNTGTTSSAATKKNTATSKANTAKPTETIALTNSQGGYFTYTITGANKLLLNVSAVKGKNSWVEIYDTSASGKRYYYGSVSAVGSQNQSFNQDLSSLKQIYLKIGNVQNVSVSINGKAVSLSQNPVFQHITLVNKK